jgi:hypothetical protein
MRSLSESQCDAFLSDFGQPILTSTGSTFTGIVEVLPVSIDTGGGYVEGTEKYVSVKKINNVLEIGTVIIIEGTNYVIYDIQDDLSGMLNAYFRTQEGQSFAEDY